jgi:peptidoglycan hydrolase-like protein with peptidoglycan-binding domain
MIIAYGVSAKGICRGLVSDAQNPTGVRRPVYMIGLQILRIDRCDLRKYVVRIPDTPNGFTDWRKPFERFRSKGLVMNTRKKLSVALVLLATLLFIAPTQSSASTKEKRKGSRNQLTRTEAKDAEARLSEMGYRPGRVDGVVDGATRGALIVFQKWERRKVTGRLNREEYDAIMNATAPEPRDTGYKHVEIDVDRQVLLLIDSDGTVTRILPVSTGSNKHYKEKLMSGLAYTPRGRFRVDAKIPGWRKSPLGLLYYPSYFSGGIAIHGNPDVPNTPQSHGCVRIPMSEAVDMYKQLPIGTIVLVYDSLGFVSAQDWAKADREKQQAKIQ